VLHRLTAAVLLLLAATQGAVAHDIPADARINMFVKPAGERLELLMRVPLLVMREVDFPTRGPGYLEISKADEALRNAAKLWLSHNIEIYENGTRLPLPRVVAARVSLPSDRSFASFEEARAHLDEPPLPDDLDLYWNQQLLDVLLEVPIGSDRAELAIRPRLDRLALKLTTALRFLPPDGTVRAFEFHGDPGLVRLDPRWHQAALRFVVEGFRHILDGTDHLLFLACLVIPFRRLRPLVVIVTSFTVAHSISLIASAFGFVPDGLWFPPLVETLIAATVFLMALENIVGSNIRRRWIAAFAFGLVHGFGFSFALREQLQFAGDYLLTSLLAFNLGVELGQLAVLLVMVPALALLFRHVVRERLGIIILSVLVGHTAWHWMLERGEQLAQFPLPPLDAAFLAGAMRALMAALILAALVWFANARMRRLTEDPLPQRDLP
jgi:hypothetical protein